MALQYSVAVRNAQLDAVESTTGTAALLRIYSVAVTVPCAWQVVPPESYSRK